ncbi:MAG: winged helix-turn-helix transcriptional regulator, partial [Alphaproteobacteria bacterium]
EAFMGARRFGEFQTSLGLARNILTVRLRTLVAHGILERAPASDGSAYREYVLTEKGRGLFIVLVALRQWGSEYFFASDPCGTLLVDRARGRPVGRLALRAEDGRLLGPDDVALKNRIKPSGGRG